MKNKEQQLLEKLSKLLGTAPTVVLKEEKIEPIVEEKKIEEPQIQPVENVSSVEKIAEFIGKQNKQQVGEAMYPTPIPQGDRDLSDAMRKISHLEHWVSRIAATGPGSGEVNFRYLDDVERSTMTGSNDNWVLEYDATTGNVKFTEDIGPIQTVWFDPTHIDTVDEEGLLNWSTQDKTLNLHHANGVTQQIGQEQYYLARNVSGNTITNGTCVRFSGAQMNGTARILVEPFLADGTYPNLYVLGIATQDIANNTDGFVTSFGKVRDLDTTGNTVSEVWSLGDILYAHPTIAGALTKVKPTAPQNVNPTAAVLRVDTTEGEIFVRPTFEQKQSYASFMRATDQIAPNTNFGHVIGFSNTLISNGIELGTPNSHIVVSESGLFQFDTSIQITSTNSSTKNVRFWYRRNGTDIPNSSRITTIDINNGYTTLQLTQTFSLQANDYMELVFATTDTAAYPHAAPSNAYSPDAPAVLLAVNQAQL